MTIFGILTFLLVIFDAFLTRNELKAQKDIVGKERPRAFQQCQCLVGLSVLKAQKDIVGKERPRAFQQCLAGLSTHSWSKMTSKNDKTSKCQHRYSKEWSGSHNRSTKGSSFLFGESPIR